MIDVLLMQITMFRQNAMIVVDLLKILDVVVEKQSIAVESAEMRASVRNVNILMFLSG